MKPHALAFTYEDYLLLPEGDRRELIGGDFVVTPAPSPRHQRICIHLERRLTPHVEGQPPLGRLWLSPIDVVLSETDVVQPDLVYVATARLSIVTDRAIEGAPDLAVEVVSPSTEQRDRRLKRALYARAGVKELWLVDPRARAIEVLARGKQRYALHGRFGPDDALTSPLLPGFALDPVRDVFRD
jgi:Uma2 family endonuclease